jgi:hypothetical protein
MNLFGNTNSRYNNSNSSQGKNPSNKIPSTSSNLFQYDPKSTNSINNSQQNNKKQNDFFSQTTHIPLNSPNNSNSFQSKENSNSSYIPYAKDPVNFFKQFSNLQKNNIDNNQKMIMIM